MSQQEELYNIDKTDREALTAEGAGLFRLSMLAADLLTNEASEVCTNHYKIVGPSIVFQMTGCTKSSSSVKNFIKIDENKGVCQKAKPRKLLKGKETIKLVQGTKICRVNSPPLMRQSHLKNGLQLIQSDN